MHKYREKINSKLLKILIISIVTIFVALSGIMKTLATEVDPNTITPSDNQYFELKAVEIKDVAGQNKQIIMELWGHNMEFKRIWCTFLIW